MGFKSFRWNVFIRLVILLIMLGLLAYYLVVSGKYIRGTYLGMFIIGLLIELFYYVDRRNRELVSFFAALKNEDSTLRFRNMKKGRTFRQLYEVMNEVSEKFQTLRRDRELQFQYLQALLEHVRVGIISFDDEDRIHMVNQAFRKYFDTPGLKKDMYLKNINERIATLFREIKPDERRSFQTDAKSEHSITLTIRGTEFRLGEQHYKLVSAQNIKQELEQQEIIAWQKLIRILTHEIMNSVTPVSSLSASLYDLLSRDRNVSNESYKKLRSGLEAIMDRSQGLMNFTEAYKSMTRIPPPRMTSVSTDELASRIEALFRSLIGGKGIELKIDHKAESLHFQSDPELLDMVLLNLMNNAVDAVEGSPQPRIVVGIRESGSGRIAIRFEDNGAGMDSEVLDQIYVPFFTTKAKGTGIGLSISNQIVRSLGGYITVRSTPGKGTVFDVVIGFH